MTSLRHYPLGETCPSSPHAVVSSLPTMADVRGYEEREPRVLDALQSGYPRFVVHAFIRELVEYYLKRENLEDRAAVLIPGRRATQDLVDYIGRGVTSLKVEGSRSNKAVAASEMPSGCYSRSSSSRDAAAGGTRAEAPRYVDSELKDPGQWGGAEIMLGDLFLVHFDAADRDLGSRVRKFVQHTGCGISSRQAEDLLCAHGLRDAVHPEAGFVGTAQAEVDSRLAELIGCESKDVLVCASGMNAFYAGFRAVQEAQYARGRTQWLQLGWLYLDSGCVLKEFLNEGELLDCCYDATDTEAILRRIELCGDQLACVVIECPTNPLVQVADLPRISEAVRACGGVLMIDPTIASVYNVDVLPYADLLVTSLTKYASFEGDVMIGALALNPESPHYGDLVLRTSSFYQPPYARDLARLAEQMRGAPEAVAQMDANARLLADYLNVHPAVKKVHYAGYSPHFVEVAKSAGSGGGMITIELNGDIDRFYDALEVIKGPSFGTRFTLVCPFMYLAHYDLVTTPEGRDFLKSIHIDPDLIRISVGTEPIELIQKVLAQAFECAKE